MLIRKLDPLLYITGLRQPVSKCFPQDNPAYFQLRIILGLQARIVMCDIKKIQTRSYRIRLITKLWYGGTIRQMF